MPPPRRSATSIGRRFATLLIAVLSLGLAHAESLDSSAQRRLREGTLEVVLEKPETDPQRKGNWIDVIRHPRPSGSLPEAFTERWHTIETGSHPFTSTAYSTNGGTRIDAVQDFKDVSAGHRSMAYTVSVGAEGTQDRRS